MTETPGRVWITRARPGAEETAARVTALGRAPLVSPVLQARAIGAGPIDLRDVGALAFTSARGVEAFAARASERDLPVFTVGEATARAARAAGFARVTAGDGDVEALADLIGAHGRSAGPVLHAAAAQPAGDLVGDLARRSIPARALAVYETVEVAPAEALAGLSGISEVLVHSPRAARLLATLLAGKPTESLRFLALSPAVAQPLAALKCAGIGVAPFPNDASLLNLL